MRIIYPLLLLVLLTASVPAKEIVLCSYESPDATRLSLFPYVFGGKSETFLQQSDDSREGEINMDETAVAQWFVSPSRCRITKIELFNCYYGSKDIAVWLDNGGAPSYPGGEYGHVSHTFTGNTWDWDDPINILSQDINLYFGVKFWAGVLDSPGRDPRMGFDTTNPDRGLAIDTGSGWTTVAGQDLMIRVYINDDMDPPYIDNRNPADGQHGVPYNANITFHVKDPDAGIASGSIQDDMIIVTDDTKAAISGGLSVNYSDPHDAFVTFNPYDNFTEGVVVTVTVSPPGHAIEDVLGNEMDTDVWSFTVTSAGVETTSLGEIKANWE